MATSVAPQGPDPDHFDESAATWAVDAAAHNTAATRHLSAGAYVDPDFRAAALEQIYYAPRRLAAPSYGFEAITVLGHCLRAQRITVVRDALLLGVALLTSWSSLLAVTLLLLTLWTVHLVVLGARIMRDSLGEILSGRGLRDVPDGEAWRVTRFGSRRRDPSAGPPPQRRVVRLWLEDVLVRTVAAVFSTTVLHLAFLVLAVLLEVTVWRHEMFRDRFVLPPLSAWLGSLAAVLAVCAVTQVWSRVQLRHLAPGCDTAPPVTSRRLAQIAEQNRGNTVVYSGYQPFVGSGELLRRWDLTQRLVRRSRRLPGVEVESEAQREFQTPPFTAEQISDYVRDHIEELARDQVPERRLAALTVDDRVFVAGTEIANLQPQTSDAEMEAIIRDPTAPERRYLQCQVVSWRGELVTTVYVHFAVQGRSLYVELQVWGLFPCDERYRLIDQVGGTSVTRALADAGRAALAAPLLLATAPTGLARVGAGQLRLLRDRRAAGQRVRRGYDYGAVVGLRELGTSTRTRDHIQMQDIAKYGRVVERRVLAAILDFLEDSDVDVTEYRQQSLTVLNAGAVATAGGTVTVTGDAVGNQINGNSPGGTS